MFKINTGYKVLVRLIKLSERNYGIINYSNSFYDNFPEISEETLYKILNYLCAREYIDLILPDDEHSFDSLYILPNGYKCLEDRKIVTLNTTLSIIAIIIAILSLFR